VNTHHWDRFPFLCTLSGLCSPRTKQKKKKKKTSCSKPPLFRSSHLFIHPVDFSPLYFHLIHLCLFAMTAPSSNDPLSNTLAPSTAATLTIRVIKSFEYRTSKNLILHSIDLTATTVGQLKAMIIESKCYDAKPDFMDTCNSASETRGGIFMTTLTASSGLS